MKNRAKRESKSNSIAVINLYVLIFSFIPFLLNVLINFEHQSNISVVLLTLALIVTTYGFFITKRISSQEKSLIQTEAEIEKLKTHDHLTQLPNRRLLEDRFKQNALLCKRNKQYMALCVIDIDDFKEINDNLGHMVGDEALKQIAERISGVLREHDTLARVGGDEFVLMLINFTEQDCCDCILQRLLEVIRVPFIINNFTLNLTISIGFALYPNSGNNFQLLYKNADSALCRSKQRGKNCFTAFDDNE